VYNATSMPMLLDGVLYQRKMERDGIISVVELYSPLIEGHLPLVFALLFSTITIICLYSAQRWSAPNAGQLGAPAP